MICNDYLLKVEEPEAEGESWGSNDGIRYCATLHKSILNGRLVIKNVYLLSTRYGLSMLESRLGIVKSLACITNAHLQCEVRIAAVNAISNGVTS